MNFEQFISNELQFQISNMLITFTRDPGHRARLWLVYINK